MSLPYYVSGEIAERHDEIRGKLKNQPAWCLRDGLIKEWLKDLPKDAAITDLGSGIGEMERQIFAMGFSQVTSVDIDDYLDRNLIGASPCFMKANLSADKLDIADASQDAVLATQVFEHLENPWNCAREILRIAKPGAKIIVSIPHATSFINRLTFFRTGHIDSYGMKNNHISLFTNATFWLLWHGAARVVRTDVAEGYLKLFGRKLRFPAHTRLGRAFTRKIAYVMEKI